MIPKNIQEITSDDINGLFENQIPESRTNEYKLELPNMADSKKIPFLAEVSAFANTEGGDLLFGISENNGVPESIPGIELDDLDKEILRLDSVIRSGIEPGLNDFSIKAVSLSNDRYVIVIRVKRSWNGPHKVIKNDKFYRRHSAGKYPLDVAELRDAFTISERLTARIRRFRKDRAYSIKANEDLPVSLPPDGRIVFHLIPQSSLVDRSLNVLPKLEHHGLFMPIGSTASNNHINIDGIIRYYSRRKKQADTYCQLYRNGIVESVVCLSSEENGLLIIPSIWYEKEIIRAAKSYIAQLSKIAVAPPYYIFISFLGMGNHYMSSHDHTYGSSTKFGRDIVLFPEAVIENSTDSIAKVLKPIFDMVWNAFGYEGSLNYDDEGNWRMK